MSIQKIIKNYTQIAVKWKRQVGKENSSNDFSTFSYSIQITFALIPYVTLFNRNGF